MKHQTKRIVAIVLIIAISIGLGFTVDSVWTLIERRIYPLKYDEAVSAASEEFDVPKHVIYATIKVESGFDPDAVSRSDARGLMQMVRPTFEWLAGDEHLGEHISYSEVFEVDTSIRYGTYYLSYLYKKFDYNWDTALAAYNAGEGNVAKWLADTEYSDGNGNLTNIPCPETEKYVRKINRAIEMYQKLYPEHM